MSNYETLSEMNERALSDIAKDEIISNQQKAIIKLVREHSIEIGKLKRELERAKSKIIEELHIKIDGTEITSSLIELASSQLGVPEAKIIRSNQQEIDELEIMLSASERENLELKRIIENQKKAILKLAKE